MCRKKKLFSSSLIAGIGGFVEVNGAIIYYGYNSCSLLLALLGIAAFATKQRGWALAYSVVLGLVVVFGLAVAILLGVTLGAVASQTNHACSQYTDPSVCDGANLGVGVAGIVLAAVFGTVTCINLMCLGCGIGYYKELKNFSPTYVILPAQQAQTNIHIHNQQQFAPQQGMPPHFAPQQGQPPQFAPPTTYTPPQQHYQPPMADVPGVFTKQ